MRLNADQAIASLPQNGDWPLARFSIDGAGHGSKEVARRLRISFHTVRVHLARTYAKLGLHKQTELAARMGARFGKL